MIDPLAIEGPVLVRAVVYHTIDHAVAHEEGEEYTVDTPALFQTLYACGFVDLVPSDPKAP
jgi:hypothetical protein